MAELGGGVDEFQGHLLQGLACDLWQEGLAHGDDALAWAHNGALEHHPVLVHLTIVGEATHRSDGLFGEIILRLGIYRIFLQVLTNAVNLLVDLSTVVVTTLTTAGHLEGHTGRMPGANAGHFSKATVSLAHQTGDAPAGHHAVEALALGGTNDIDHLILGEDILNLHLLLKETHHEVHLVRSAATIHLNLLDVRLLLADHFANLRVTNSPNHLAVLLGPFHLSVHGTSLLALFLPALLVLGEGLLFGGVPRLVEAPLALLRQMSRPDRGQRTKTTGSLHVAHETHHHHWWALQDRHRLYNLFLIQL
mmetsp:Transcript_56803/g.89945  ORF Transcript_56803/g.89945 Transcript_56803/m.89945 type:complete len:307 (-) Transcript_56803:242-1162(-)